MTPCAPTEHEIRLVEMDHDGTSYYLAECARCLTMVPVAPNVCSCNEPLDNHRFFLSDTPVCPPRQK